MLSLQDISDTTIVNLTFGTENAITVLEDLLVNRSNSVDTVLLNLTTMIRNQLSKDISFEKQATRVVNQMKEIVERLAKLVRDMDHPQKFALLFYLVRCHHLVPQDIRAGQSKNVLEITYVEEYVMQQLGVTKSKLPLANIEHLAENTDNKRTIDVAVFIDQPHLHMLRSLRQAITQLDTMKLGVFMMSHRKIDYLTLRGVASTSKAVQSFTGELIPYAHFNSVFLESDKLPFCQTAFQLLGEKNLFKSTLSRVDKARLKEHISSGRFAYVSEELFTREMLQSGFLRPKEVTYPQLL